MKTIYIDKTVRETKDLFKVLNTVRNGRKSRRAGEIVIEARDRVQLEVAGYKPYAKVKGFDLFFEELKPKRVLVIAKPLDRNPVDRLVDMVTLGTFRTLA